MTALIVSLVVVAVLWFVWRYIESLWAPREPAEPVDPDSLVPVVEVPPWQLRNRTMKTLNRFHLDTSKPKADRP